MKRILLAITMTIMMMTAISCGYDRGFQPSDVTENENIIQSKSFYVSSESTELETSIRGTIFLSGDNGIPEHAQIVAWVEIDPNDWGGIACYIPKGWRISGITSSYPENEPQKNPADFVGIWYTADADFYPFKSNERIEIASDYSWKPTGGGTGTVVIELYATEEAMNSTEAFSIMVGVGCDEEDGIKSRHPDYEVIEVPIPQEQ